MHLLNATGNNRIALIYHLQITDQSVYENLLITEIATHKLVSTTIALQFVVTTQTEFNTWGFDATVSIHAPAKGATVSSPKKVKADLNVVLARNSKLNTNFTKQQSYYLHFLS